MKKYTIFQLLFYISATIFSQQAFNCNEGSFYQVISGVMKSYDPITGSYSEALHSYSPYNAGGYNRIDNYLYAIKNKDKHLLRIAKDMVIDLGAVSPNGTTTFGGGYAADIDHEGNLWVFQNTNKKTFHKIMNVKNYNGSLTPTFEVIETDKASPSTCADIVFINKAIYGGSRGKLYKWDLSSGTPIFSSKEVTNLPRSTFGAAYTDTDNRLYLSDNNGGLYLVNNYDSDNPTATLLNLTETTNSNDGFKCANSISPLDKDQDGILDSMDADCDGDGITNIMECNGNDPFGDDDRDDLYNYLDGDVSGNGDNVVQDAYDRDSDGIPDFFDIDSDNDGIYDIVEAGYGTYDTNNDGLFNGLDTNFKDINTNGVADAFDIDQTSSEFSLLDTDNDGIYNCYDTDSDNDGIVDIIESQPATSYKELSTIDADNDGMDDTFDIDYNGATNGVLDTDNDGMYDHLDIDSNNNGILDNTEAYDSDGDGSPETIAAGNDNDNDGLDDNYDLRKSSFSPDNGGQTPTSFPIPEICNQYNYLGEFLSNGTPLYLEEKDLVTQETIDLATNILPESYPVPDFNPHYISSGYDTDLLIQENTDVWITFLGEGSEYKNSLGFYTYTNNSTNIPTPSPSDITIVFPNVSAINSGGGLQIGDKVKIGSFPPNTRIGWVLMANSWSNECVNTGNWQLYSTTNYNPESNLSLKHHNVLLADPNKERIFLGFEDIRRDYPSSDHDFNDALFYITASSYKSIATNNYANIDSATNVTSANDGGLESNGDLAKLIAKRNFNRIKRNSTVRNSKNRQAKFLQGKNETTNALSTYFPKTGMFGTEETHESTPSDLIEITNADNIFSVDYYQADKRVSAGLAISTIGSIYDHSKTICDRLNNSKLLDVRTLSIRNHTLVNTKIERATGEVEYALTFSIKKNEFENEIYSLWNIDDYPEGDYDNFQVWGGSVSQVSNLANHIIDTFLKEKPLRSHPVDQRIPTIFVEDGSYKNGKLSLNIINKSGTKKINFNGKIRKTELSEEEILITEINLSGNYSEQITVNTGYLFDIGFSLAGEHSKQLDTLYLADGPWGIDYIDKGAIIKDFEVLEHTQNNQKEGFIVERKIVVNGAIKETLNVFRNILAGDLSLNVSEYNLLEFEIKANTAVEVIIVTKNLTHWNNRLRYTVPASNTDSVQKIPFSKFVNANGNHSTINDIRSIVFSIQGNYVDFSTFTAEISNLKFKTSTEVLNPEGIVTIETIKEKKATTIYNYPNPFSNTTNIQLPHTMDLITITVIDLMGRIVLHEKNTASPENILVLKTKNISSGYYKYIITNTKDEQYIGSFIIQ